MNLARFELMVSSSWYCRVTLSRAVVVRLTKLLLIPRQKKKRRMSERSWRRYLLLAFHLQKRRNLQKRSLLCFRFFLICKIKSRSKNLPRQSKQSILKSALNLRLLKRRQNLKKKAMQKKRQTLRKSLKLHDSRLRRKRQTSQRAPRKYLNHHDKTI